jgi:hypothetical protein
MRLASFEYKVKARFKINAKHLGAYLAEMTSQFNCCKSRNLFMGTLRHMITADLLTFDRLAV